MQSVVLFSGGLDSAVALALELEAGYDVWPVWCRYGQRHAERERLAMRAVTHHYGLWERVQILGFDYLRGSHLTGAGDLSLPGVVVPLRNPLLVLNAANYAVSVGAKRVVIGCNATDCADFPDCRLPVFRHLNALIDLCGYDVEVDAPLCHLTKAEVVAEGRRLGVPLTATWSCYQGDEQPCGMCPACEHRREALS